MSTMNELAAGEPPQPGPGRSITTAAAPVVPFRDALHTWTRVGLLSFGGPAGQIAVMHRILVEEKRWVSDAQFLHALNYWMLLPGPEAQQLATYMGGCCTASGVAWSPESCSCRQASSRSLR
jgi:hypothetical protein